MSRREYLRIGYVVRAHGVHGDVKAQPLTDEQSRFRGLADCFVERRGNMTPAALTGVKLQPDAVILHFNGIDTPEAAAEFIGAYICVDRAHAVALPDHTFFVAELVGCETFDTDGKCYGRVTDVLETGANDVYEIEGGRLMVPALRRVLHEVDIENGRIVFDAAALREVGLFED